MAENLRFSLECVTPYFILIVIGYFCARTGLASREFLTLANRFTFRVALPVNLFLTAASIDWEEGVDPGFLGFLFLTTLLGFTLIWLLTELLFRDKAIVGTLVQGAFRGNYVLLGIPIVTAVVGNGPGIAKAAVASAVVVPLYNVLSVVVLMARGKNAQAPRVGKLLLGVLKNPLILGTVGGVLVSLLPVQMPVVAQTSLGLVGQVATPLGLLSVGGIFNWKDATAKLKLSFYSVLFKNLLLCLLMLPLSHRLGYQGDELVILLIAFAAPVSVSSFPMACELGGDPPLAANILILTTFFSAFVMAAGIYIMKTLGWI